MFRLPETPSRDEVLTFISKSASYGNLGAFIGAGFSKAVLNNGAGGVALSWGELLEQSCKNLEIEYATIQKEGVSYPDIASAICTAHSATKGLTYSQSLSCLKREIASLTSWYPDREQRESFSGYLSCLAPSWIITTNYDLVIEGLLQERLHRLVQMIPFPHPKALFLCFICMDFVRILKKLLSLKRITLLYLDQVNTDK